MFTNPSQSSSARSGGWKVLYHSLYMLLESGTDGWKFCNFFFENSDRVSDVMELEVAFQFFFQLHQVYLRS
jgi:hypothetical protein